MTVKFTTVPTKRLAETIDGTAYSFSLQDIKGWNGSNISSSDFGTEMYASFRNSLGTKMELMKIDPATIASASITILKRGLGFDGDQTTEVTANIQDVWVKGDTLVELGSHVSQLLEETVRKSGDQTVGGKKTFSTVPDTTGGDAVADNDLVRFAQARALLTGTTTVNRIVVTGTAGETITADQLIYLKASDGRWWLADADTASTDENVVLGIAQGGGTAGNTITNGILLQGLATFTAITVTANTKYYASNTAGAFSSTPGTTEVTLGISQTTTTFMFCPRYDQQLTEDQQDALVGNNTDITVGAGNKLVTQTGVQKIAEKYATTSGSANTYIATLSPQPTSYGSLSLSLKANFANTGAALLNIGIPTTVGTVTMTIASPAVFSYTSHGLVDGDIVRFTTSGALPTGITAGTDYYVISAGLTSNAFEVSTSNGGSAVNTSGSQSGTHTLYRMTRNITKGGTSALVSGDIASGQVFTVVDDGTQWQLQSQTVTPTFAGATGPYSITTSVGSTVAVTVTHSLGVVPKNIKFFFSAGTSGGYGEALVNSAGTVIAQNCAGTFKATDGYAGHPQPFASTNVMAALNTAGTTTTVAISAITSTQFTVTSTAGLADTINFYWTVNN